MSPDERLVSISGNLLRRRTLAIAAALASLWDVFQGAGVLYQGQGHSFPFLAAFGALRVSLGCGFLVLFWRAAQAKPTGGGQTAAI